MKTADELRRAAVELAKRDDFGPESLRLNQELVAAAPTDTGAWTRLARCWLAAHDYTQAEAAANGALALNPKNQIAINLRAEALRGGQVVDPAPVRQTARSRAGAPRESRPTGGGRPTGTAAVSEGDPVAGGLAFEAGSGFTPDFFDRLGLGSRAVAKDLETRFESLLISLNSRGVTADIARLRDTPGGKLFRRNSFHWDRRPGHLYAFHNGGRWEPQFNIGAYSGRQWGADCVRAGLAFNLTREGSSGDASGGQPQALAYFRAFQKVVRARWQRHLAQWMREHAGLLHWGDRGPKADWPVERQVEWLVSLKDPVDQGGIFVGRWLYLHNAEDRETLTDLGRLTNDIASTFHDFVPLWRDVRDHVEF